LSADSEYEVVVADSATFGAWSEIVYTKMPSGNNANAPSGLSGAATSQTQINLQWTRNSSTNTGVTVYKDGAVYSTEAAGATTKSVTGLTAGTTYRFKVENTAGQGFSNEISVATPLDPLPGGNDPTSLTAEVIGNGNQVLLNWNRNSGSNGRVERSFNGSSYSTIVSSLGTTQTYTDTPGFDRHVWYKVFNATGGSNYSNIVDVWTSSDPVDHDPFCVTLDTLILVVDFDGLNYWKRADEIRIGAWLVNKYGDVSVVTAIQPGRADRVYTITTENGFNLRCSSTHPIIRDLSDAKGTPAASLNVGDQVLTWTEAGATPSRISKIEVGHEPSDVTIFSLRGEHSFIAGGIVSHNVKIQ
jgi:hypothetical protein